MLCGYEAVRAHTWCMSCSQCWPFYSSTARRVNPAAFSGSCEHVGKKRGARDAWAGLWDQRPWSDLVPTPGGWAAAAEEDAKESWAKVLKLHVGKMRFGNVNNNKAGCAVLFSNVLGFSSGVNNQSNTRESRQCLVRGTFSGLALLSITKPLLKKVLITVDCLPKK